MLKLIGLGLGKDYITLRGLKEAKNSDVVYAELYTSVVDVEAQELEKLIGKKIIFLERKDLEENLSKIIEEAKKKVVSILVGGDPLIATTHAVLRMEAQKNGIKTVVVHNASILSAAIGKSGLHNYKFGASATVAFPYKDVIPETPYNVLKENISRGLHTLLFLDLKIDKNEKRMMTANEAMEILLKIEKKRKERIFTEDTLCIVLARIGYDDEVVRAGAVGELVNEDFGKPPHCLIIPGNLHFMEKEYLKLFAGLR